jgi:integrase
MQPELIAALEAVERRGAYVVLAQYGRAFNVKALGMRMQDWTKRAGTPPGYTLHGLRKTLGKMLPESGATAREIMSILGHDSLAHAELYTREAEQKSLPARYAKAGEGTWRTGWLTLLANRQRIFDLKKQWRSRQDSNL